MSQKPMRSLLASSFRRVLTFVGLFAPLFAPPIAIGLLLNVGDARADAAPVDAAANARTQGFDWILTGGVRSVPIGAAVIADVGYSQPAWGDWRDSKNYLYGFIRPSLKLTTSGTINSAEGGVTLAPISFLTINYGHILTWRPESRMGGIDCNRFECGGSLRGDRLSARLITGVGNLIVIGDVESRPVQADRADREFYEDETGARGSRGSDRVRAFGVSLGGKLKLPPSAGQWVVGVSQRRDQMENSGDFSERLVVYASTTSGMWRILGGLGIYRSGLVGPDPMAIVLVEYLPKIGLSI